MADLQDQLTKYLTDAYSIEEQALAQLRTAPDLAGDPELERIFRDHLVETEGQELEIAGYELLKRVAAKAGDEQTVAMADSIIVEERAMAGSVQALFGAALDASLAAQGVAA